MKHKITSLIVLILIVCVFASCDNSNKSIVTVDDYNPQHLQILNADFKLTHDQMQSKIKADHLIKNKGYLASDDITLFIELNSDSLLNTYNQLVGYQDDLNMFSKTNNGQEIINKIHTEQQSLINTLISKKLIKEVVQTYDTIMNAICVKTTYGKIEEISKLSNVSDTMISETYNLPTIKSVDTTNITNIVDIYETGIFNSSSVKYTGNGTAVAVLDSGFDCSHTVFQNQPEKPLYTKEMIEDILSTTRAKEFTTDLTIDDVYYSSKIPFIYDYADKDADSFPYDSEHGTHVSGIIGGKDDVITGVAVNTQLVLMKVFPDLDAGGRTEDILLALEDAVKLGVDVINMSLGTACGFSRESDNDKVNKIYDEIGKSGISLVTAASNDYSSAYGGEQGNTNKVTNPDSGTVGSPSTYPSTLSVASISGVKSKFLLANDESVVFFKESNNVTGKENDFFKELGIEKGVTKSFEYVTIPGVGLKINYRGLDLNGKVALVQRGNNTFEEKAAIAKEAGAIACIIYNNVQGEILMSMGKSDHIPTISISNIDGSKLAQKSKGTLVLSSENEAGPFMSDFSSWGPTPSLDLKPEITGHGGTIKSAIPGGEYDELSGTSMATPNLSGIVILIRQYLKERFPNYSSRQVAELTNSLLMSTATIAKNTEGNPYSPRKQGAGLASLYNSVNTKAYLSVDNNVKPKLELRDDPNRVGTYEMIFNVHNLSNESLSYDLSLVSMTESVSSSDTNFVAEMSYLLNGSNSIEVLSDGNLNGNTLTIGGNKICKVKVTYTLSNEDKEYIESSFPYGMYVEGFIKLISTSNEIPLNIPFLAFYGDWTEAPLLDRTYFEVDADKKDLSLNEEDKLKADYFATTPYGSYMYNYMIPLGTYLYDIDSSKYDEIPASLDKIAISNMLGTIDGISTVYAGMLRNARKVEYKITEKITGKVVYTHTDYNAGKAHYYGGIQFPYFDDLKVKSSKYGFVNNRVYEFSMQPYLDYGDGGVKNNVRNYFSFDFTLDDEAPVIKDVTYQKTYDKQLKKDRYYMYVTVYDNQYAMSITPIIFNSSSSYTFLEKDPIPIYGGKGEDSVVKIEITDYLEDIYNDNLITSALAFSIDDYALNSNLYMVQLPGTKGEFKFTKNGTMDSTELLILSLYEDEVVDLTKLLATKDTKVLDTKDYLNHLKWSSSNENVAIAKEGFVLAKKEGRTTVIVEETMDNKKAALLLNVKKRPEDETLMKQTLAKVADNKDTRIETLRFDTYDTVFAYSRAAQTNEIGKIGNRSFVNATPNLSFYPGEQIKLHYDFNPWYAEEKYELTYASSNPLVASVDENGVVTGNKEGNATITLKVKGSNIMATMRITIKSEFVIENRTLIAYKGKGGKVVIPDDEGILYIGAYAFCLYDTDNTIELSDDDYDANKIPAANTSITSIVIPEGVEEIQKYAFYNCSGLKEVLLPESCKLIRDYAFMNDVKLETINTKNITVMGKYAFYGCKNIKSIDFIKIYALGERCFEGCSSLEEVNLTTLRNTGVRAFKDTTSLKKVVMGEHTKLSKEMFVNSGFTSIDIYESNVIPEWAFAKCENLTTVNIHNNLLNINKGAFAQCPSLKEFNINGKLSYIGEQAFYEDEGLVEFRLPSSNIIIDEFAFYKCKSLKRLEFMKDTYISQTLGYIFRDTSLSEFIVDKDNLYYSVKDSYLTNKEQDTIILSPTFSNLSTITIDNSFKKISTSAFSSCLAKTVVIENPNMIIDDYAFASVETLESIVLPANGNIAVKSYAFNICSNLKSVENSTSIKELGEYAFANSGITNITLRDNLTISKGAFFTSKLETITIGANSILEDGSIQQCDKLTTVNFTGDNITIIGAVFAFDTKLVNIDLSHVYGDLGTLAFYNCTSLRKANLTNVTSIGIQSFLNCKSLFEVTLPNVTSIGDGAFSYEAKGGNAAPCFKEIILPDTLTHLGKEVFGGNNYLESIIIPDGITSIGDFTFFQCGALKKVVLPKSVKSIGKYGFAGCGLLTDINLDNVETINEYAFTSDMILEQVNLNNVVLIEEGAFANCYELCELGNLDELVKVGAYAFQSTKLVKFDAPKLEIICDGAFTTIETLKEFVISNTIKEVQAVCFNGSTSLEKFTYLNNNGVSSTGTINDYAILDNGVLYVTLPNGEIELKAVPAGFTKQTLVVLDGCVRVDLYAGNENKKVINIIFPKSLLSIGNRAFYGYDALRTVRFKSIQAPILEDVYSDGVTLDENAPGYELLHNQFDLFGFELYYYTFKDLAGSFEPITMILPANKDLEGYDTLPYIAYFGGSSKALIDEEYYAPSSALTDFVYYANKIKNIDVIRTYHSDLIDKAIFAYNSIKDNPIEKGYTNEEFDSLKDITFKASDTLFELKKERAGTKVKLLNKKILDLPDKFDISILPTLSMYSSELSKLSQESQELVVRDKYDNLMNQYKEYISSVNNEAGLILASSNNTFAFVNIAISIASFALLGAFAFIKFKKGGIK